MVTVAQTIGLILVGLLAGTELIVRYGVQPALTRLPDTAHVLARQALVQRLRVVVPILMVPTVGTAVAVLAVAGGREGLAFRWVGIVCLAAFLIIAFFGTVPINIQVNGWDPERPPADRKAVVGRWERLDVARSTAAIAAFVSFAMAIAVQLGAPG